MATTRKEIDAADASTFDASENRTVSIGRNATETSSGCYVDPASLDAAVPRAGTEMPKPIK